jgi:hypothetical protein
MEIVRFIAWGFLLMGGAFLLISGILMIVWKHPRR